MSSSWLLSDAGHSEQQHVLVGFVQYYQPKSDKMLNRFFYIVGQLLTE